MFSKKKKRTSNEISAGSMADIAFLLLIFFLVTTTIVMDEGILVKLPPWDPDIVIQKYPERNVLAVKVNKNNELLVEGEEVEVSALRNLTKDFITNPLGLEKWAESSQKAIISLQNDRETSYETYLSVYNELKGAYSELRQEESLRMYGKSFDQLPRNNKRIVFEKIPMVISEAEPTDFVVE